MGTTPSKEGKQGTAPSTSPVTLRSFPAIAGLAPVIVKCEDPPPPPPPGVVAAPPPPPDSIEAAAKEASGIPNPGRYEEAATDGKRLVTLDTFDGLRFDINKQLSPYMAVVHSFWLGTSMIPDGRNKTYTFITQVADESGMFFTRVDFDRGAVDGRVHRALLGGIAMGKLQLGVSKDGQQDQCLAELDFGGQTWTGNLKYGSMAQGIIFGMNYLQSITPRLAMGGEGMYVASNQSLMSNYTLKYTMPASSGENNVSDDSRPSSSAVAPDSPSSSMCVNFNAGMGALTMNYKRIVTPNRVTLGAELQCSPFDLSQSQVLVGGEFKLTRSKISLCVDGGGRIQSLVEAKLGTGGAPTIQFSGELDHYSNVMRFGYGLNIDA